MDIPLDTAFAPAFGSGFAAGFDDLLAVFASDFLFVTGAFDCIGGALAPALDKGFALDGFTAVLVPAFATVFTETFFSGLAVLAAADPAFFGSALLVALTALDFTVLAEDVWGFAGFFIAFAMESTYQLESLIASTSLHRDDFLPISAAIYAYCRKCIPVRAIFQRTSNHRKALNQKLLSIAQGSNFPSMHHPVIGSVT